MYWWRGFWSEAWFYSPSCQTTFVGGTWKDSESSPSKRNVLPLRYATNAAWTPLQSCLSATEQTFYRCATQPTQHEHHYNHASAPQNNVLENINPLDSKGIYSATSNNTKLVHWPLMCGLLYLVLRGGAWAGWGPAQSPPRCTINGQCTNHYSHSFTDKKIQDFSRTPWQIFQEIFRACECSNIKKKRHLLTIFRV